MNLAQKDNANQYRQDPSEDNLSGAKTIHNETYDWRCDTSFYSLQSRGHTKLGPSPSHLHSDWVQENTHAVDEDYAHVKMEQHVSRDYIPAVEDARLLFWSIFNAHDYNLYPR